MYYNKLKQLITYLNYFILFYIWFLIFYAIMRYTGLIKSSPLGEILLIPIKKITASF